MRTLLAFDTSTRQLAVGLARLAEGSPQERRERRRPEILATADEDAPRAANTRLLPVIRGLLSGAGLDPEDIDVVAVGRGPGSYTGVRIGMASAKGLAQGLAVPLLGVSSLDAVAWRVASEKHEGVLAVVADAMRGEVYTAAFRLLDGSAERIDPVDVVGVPEKAGERWAGMTVDLATGDGLEKHASVLASALPMARVLDERLWRPSGRGLIEAAAAALDAEGGDASAKDPGVVLPVYTNLSDAEARERPAGTHVPSSGVAGPGGEEGGESG